MDALSPRTPLVFVFSCHETNISISISCYRQLVRVGVGVLIDLRMKDWGHIFLLLPTEPYHIWLHISLFSILARTVENSLQFNNLKSFIILFFFFLQDFRDIWARTCCHNFFKGVWLLHKTVKEEAGFQMLPPIHCKNNCQVSKIIISCRSRCHSKSVGTNTSNGNLKLK